MPMEYSRWEARSAADAGPDFGFAALAMCRAYRGVSGVKSATYWVQGWGRLGFLVETEPGTDIATLNSYPEVAKAGVALSELARNLENQTWLDPGAAAATLEAASS